MALGNQNPNRITTYTNYDTGNSNVALTVYWIDYDILSLSPERYSFETATST